MAHYSSWSVSDDFLCRDHKGFPAFILLQVQTSLYRLYLQSHTFATAVCISKDKPIMFNVSVGSLWPLMKSTFSLWLSCKQKSNLISLSHHPNVFTSSILYPCTISFQGYTWVSVSVNGLNHSWSNSQRNMKCTYGLYHHNIVLFFYSDK